MRSSELQVPLEQMTDEAQLIERCKAGEQRAWREFFNRYDKTISEAVFGTLPPFIGEDKKHAVQDITQRIRAEIVRALENLQYGEKGNNIGGWVAQITRRRTIDWIRLNLMISHDNPTQRWISNDTSLSDVPEARLIDARVATPEEEAMNAQFRRRFAEAVEKLPKKERNVWKKYYVDGMTMEDIGKMEGISTGWVSRLVAATNKLLEEELKDFREN